MTADLVSGDLYVRSLQDPLGDQVQITRVALDGTVTVLTTFPTIKNSNGSGILLDPQTGGLIMADAVGGTGGRIALVSLPGLTASTLFDVAWTINPGGNGTGQQQFAMNPLNPNILYIWDSSESKIYSLNRSGGVITELVALDTGTTSGQHVTNFLNDIAFDPLTGRILLTDGPTLTVYEFDPAVMPAVLTPVIPNVIAAPRAIALDPLGRRVFVQIFGSIYMGCRGTGRLMRIATGFQDARDIVVGRASSGPGLSVYVTDKAQDTVFEISREPIIRYDFEEGSGSSISSSGTFPGTTGTFHGGAGFSTDVPSGTGSTNALVMDGVSGTSVTIPDSFDYTTDGAAASTPLDKVTVEAWVKPTSVTGQRIVWDDYGSPGVLLTIFDTKGQFGVSTAKHPGVGISNFSGTLVPDVWQHLAGVYDGRRLRVFVNGQETCALVGTRGGIQDYSTVYPGSGPTIGFTFAAPISYAGRIDDLKVYAGALNSCELAGGAFADITPIPCRKEVEIDVVPGKVPRASDAVKLKGKGKTAVAILSEPGFDAVDIDPATIRFGASVVEVASLKPKLKDVDKDGDRDLTMKFETAGAGFECGDTSAQLTGSTHDGVAFEAVGVIVTVGCS